MHEKLAAIDPETVESLKELAGESAGNFFQELVDIYRKQYEENLPNLEKALAAGQPQKLAPIMHQLRSSSGNVGALEFSALCGELEEAGINGDLALIQSKFTVFRETYGLVVKNLTKVSSGG